LIPTSALALKEITDVLAERYESGQGVRLGARVWLVTATK
jgi:hypothetical protein